MQKNDEAVRLKVQHDEGEREFRPEFEAHLESMNHGLIYQEMVADQEQRWGEERVVDNEN